MARSMGGTWFAAIFAAVCAVSAWPGPARAATCTWTGSGTGTSAAWSNAANWTCPGSTMAVPQGGDRLVFPAGAAGNGANQNDIANLSLAGIDVAGPTASNGVYSITGNRILLGGGRSVVL